MITVVLRKNKKSKIYLTIKAYHSEHQDHFMISCKNNYLIFIGDEGVPPRPWQVRPKRFLQEWYTGLEKKM